METLITVVLVVAIFVGYLYGLLRLLQKIFPAKNKTKLSEIDKALLTVSLGDQDLRDTLKATYSHVINRGCITKMDVQTFVGAGIPIDVELWKRTDIKSLSVFWRRLDRDNSFKSKLFHDALLALISKDGLYHSFVDSFCK